MSYNSKFEELIVWKKAHNLTLEIYTIVKTFPPNELYSLVDQIKRSMSSVPTNIVEGHSRKSRKEYAQFLNIAKASANELKYHLILSKDLGYIQNDIFTKQMENIDEILRMISGILSYLTPKT